MSRSARILAIVGALVVLVVAFFVLSPGDVEDPLTTATPTATTTTAAVPTTTAPAPPPPRTPNRVRIVVRNGKPVGGVERIEVKKGARALIEVSSPDTTDEVHLHGYDIRRNLTAGGRVRLLFTAKNDGIYELELEGAHVPIAELVVEP